MKISIQIRAENKIKTQKLVKCSPTDKLSEVFDEHQDGCLILKSAFVGPTEAQFDSRKMFSTELDFTLKDVMELCKFNQILFICNILNSTEEPKNAFSLLMQNAKGIKFINIEKKTEVNGKNQIWNLLIDYLEQKNLSFQENQRKIMNTFMNGLNDVIWLIEAHVDKFQKLAGCPELPKVFFPRIFRSLSYKGEKKRNPKNFNKQDIVDGAITCEKLLSLIQPIGAEWKTVLLDIQGVKAALDFYADYLTSESHRKSQGSVAEIGLRCDLYVIKRQQCINVFVSSLYKKIEVALNNAGDYNPLQIVSYAPIDKRERYRYIRRLQFNFDVQILKVKKPHHYVIWKLPDELSDNHELKVANIVALESQPHRVKEFQDQLGSKLVHEFSNKISFTQENIQSIVDLVNLDDEDVNEEIVLAEDIEYFLEDGVQLNELPELAEDLKKSKSGKFDEFWNVIEKLINEVAVPDERRHGEINYMSTLCVSLRALRERAITELRQSDPEAAIPSEEYLRLQFHPRNPHTNTAKRYYCRFNMKWKLQKRSLRKFHVDHHYGAKQLKNLKQHAGMFQDYTTFLMSDDKASVAVGSEDAPVSATRRQRHILAGLNQDLNSTDHDVVVQHIVPSCTILMTPPTDPNSSEWYGGRPEVVLKDAIFQSSNAMRHGTEFVKRLKREGVFTPFIHGLNDGGPDKNVSLIMVQLSLICLFIEMDYDFLCYGRTPPYFSTLNPIERFMCTANLALNGLALGRTPLEDEKDEKLAKSLLTKTAWRKANEKHPNRNIPLMALKSIEPAKRLIETRLKQLEYKDEKVTVGEPASENEIRDFKANLKIFFPDGDVDDHKLTSAEMAKNPLFTEFWNKHVLATHYTFQIKKCEDLNCVFHGWIRSPIEIFKTLHWCPTPEPGENDKYKTFDETFGHIPSDEFRPGAQKVKVNKPGEKPDFQLQPVRARMIITCSECEYPRLLYAKTKLPELDKNVIKDLLHDQPYICGDITVLKYADEKKVYFNGKNYCYATISPHYYASQALENFVLVCYVCNKPIEIEQANEKLPYCNLCSSKVGKKCKEVTKSVKK